MSGRVLGQYDLLVGRDDVDDAVYMVGPNLADARASGSASSRTSSAPGCCCTS